MKLLKSKGRTVSLLLTGLLIAGSVWIYSNESRVESGQNYRGSTVNAVIGDQSYLETHGKKPGSEVSETKRIKTHLKYVRNRLAEKNVSHLTDSERQNRMKNLGRLTDYIKEGSFPVNEGYPGQRRPNFIDSEGRICAVGYLIAQSEGRKAAERIKEKFQYTYVRDMQSELLTNWAERNGFTKRELAMIQPAYDWGQPEIHQAEKINRPLEALWLGTNAGLSTLNAVQGFNNTGSVVPAISGIVSGTALFTLGATRHANYSNVDMIVGTATLAAGTWGVYKLLQPQEQRQQKKLSMGVIPGDRYEKNVGIYLNVRF